MTGARAGPQQSAGALPAALADPATYGITGTVEQRETHASWVFLAGAHAYKLKKPVRLAFLDYSTPALRRAACHEELRVNRELGGEIYGEVMAVVPAAGGGVRLAPEAAAGAIDYVLRMRRFDERLTLADAIARGAPVTAELATVARLLARFHARAPRVPGGGPDATLSRWRADLDELSQLVEARAWRLDAMRRFAEAFVARHGHELAGRALAGRVRDGHGDLRCEHVLLTDPVTVVDRIEFDAQLRHVDVGCDLAFLLMDLEALGRPQESASLLDEYRRAGGDPGEDQLVWFHAARWALVRAKVAVIAGGGSGRGDAESEPARALRALAERLAWRARGKLVTVVAGPPASGKSTLAGALSERSGLPVLSSDVVRKRLAGIPTLQRGRPEHYAAEFTTDTYRALAAEARELIETGRGAIVDATFGRERDRVELLQALAGSGAQLLFAECRVSRSTALARAGERAAQSEHVSDATAEVAARLYDAYEPVGEPDGVEPLALDAEQPLECQLDALAAGADRLLAGVPARPVAPPKDS